MNQIAFEHRRRLKYKIEREARVIDNVSFRSLNFTYKEGENDYIETLYVLDNNNIEFTKDKYYSLFTYQNIIISFEEANNATI